LRKSAAEIALIRKAAEATVAAHRAAWKRMKPGLFEYQIAATMLETYLDLGCERSAYTPIVASGLNSVVLHYSANQRRMESGDLVLMDVGGEYAGYGSDVTRTVPAGGKFTPRLDSDWDTYIWLEAYRLLQDELGAERRDWVVFC
jgi:Xaa-Pro aminopeptidase